jgi:hypothetical protein
VNTVSQYGPTSGLNGADPIAEYRLDELLIPGQWYHIKTINMDHKAPLGHGLNGENDIQEMLKLLNGHCKLLWSLPS